MSMTRINSPAVTVRTAVANSSNSWHGTVTAPGVAGYTFVCWTQCSSQGWTGSAYVEIPTAKTSEVWSSDGSWPKDKGVQCTALYVKSQTPRSSSARQLTGFSDHGPGTNASDRGRTIHGGNPPTGTESGGSITLTFPNVCEVTIWCSSDQACWQSAAGNLTKGDKTNGINANLD